MRVRKCETYAITISVNPEYDDTDVVEAYELARRISDMIDVHTRFRSMVDDKYDDPIRGLEPDSVETIEILTLEEENEAASERKHKEL